MRRLSILVAVLVCCCWDRAPAPRSPSRRSGWPTGSPTGPGCSAPRQVAQQVQRRHRPAARREGTDLFVVYVPASTGWTGRNGPTTRPRSCSQFGTEDVLLAVAVDDRAYGVSVAEGYPLSESSTDAILHRRRGAAARRGRLGGAAVAMADGCAAVCAAAGPAASPSGALAVVGGMVVVGGGAYLLTRRPAKGGRIPRRRAAGARPRRSEGRVQRRGHRGPRLPGQLRRCIEVDDAVRTSEQELAAARAHFGDEAVAEFTAAARPVARRHAARRSRSASGSTTTAGGRADQARDVRRDHPRRCRRPTTGWTRRSRRSTGCATSRRGRRSTSPGSATGWTPSAPGCRRPTPDGRGCRRATPPPRWNRWPATSTRPAAARRRELRADAGAPT